MTAYKAANCSVNGPLSACQTENKIKIFAVLSPNYFFYFYEETLMGLALWTVISTVLDIGTTQNVPDKLCQTSGCHVTSHFE